ISASVLKHIWMGRAIGGWALSRLRVIQCFPRSRNTSTENWERERQMKVFHGTAVLRESGVGGNWLIGDSPGRSLNWVKEERRNMATTCMKVLLRSPAHWT